MDILKFAIEMELDGEKYYREQVAKNNETGLNAVFNILANDESNHARILKDKLNGLHYHADTTVKPSVRNVFDGLGDFKMALKSNPEQVDVYRMAAEKERQSIALYKKLLSETKEDKDLYEFLISQEEEHCDIMEEIVIMVNRPDDWAESAEFGNREEY